MPDSERSEEPSGGGRAFVSYVVLFGLLALPWLARARYAIPAYESELLAMFDAKLIVWIVAWVAHALTTAPATLFDANIFHPSPGQLTGSEAFLSSQVVAAPVFVATANAVTTANLLALVSYPIAASAMERLGRRLGLAASVAWLAGLVFALGPLRAPGNLQMVQYPNLYLPLVALALERLCDAPTIPRAGFFALVLAMGAASSMYMAAMLAVLVVVWGVLRGPRGTATRARFVGLGVAATAVAFVSVAAVLHPYFARPDASSLARVTYSIATTMGDVHRGIVLRLPELIGLVPLGLACAGMAALGSSMPVAREVARAGVAFVVVGAVLMLGPVQEVGGFAVPLPFALLNLHTYGMLRMPWRFVVVVGFGTALLVGAAGAAVERRLGPRRTSALVGLAAALVVCTRGRELSATSFEVVRAVREDRAAYEAVGAIAHARGGGPLLELPLARGASLDAGATDHMIASTVHWLPLIAGYTGYPPPHRDGLVITIARLPDPAALAALRETTGLRWILLEPTDHWERGADRTAITTIPGVDVVYDTGGWTLLDVAAR